MDDRTFGPHTVTLLQGDIAERCADALVNAANHQLQMGGGVAAALRARGGIEIHLEAIRHAPARLGDVIKTGAGKLDARYVYHAVVIDYDVSKGTSASDVAEVTKNLLRQARADGIGSLALPLFGAGVGGLSVEQSLATILDGLETVTDSADPPLHIEVVVLDDDDYTEARRAFADFQPAAERRKEESSLAEDYLRQLLDQRSKE